MMLTHFLLMIVLLVGGLSTSVLSSSSSSGGEFVDSGHLVWTTIPQQSRSEVDMWTKTSSGCACSSTTNATTPTGSTPKNNKNNKACACCNQGACQCGQKTPYRCAQCGLEQHCDQMCNVTLDASQLYAASKLRYGQIKSLEMQENQVCWYRLQPQPGFRIELQIYRLVDTGQLTNNKSSCTGGRLDWMTSGGLRPMTSPAVSDSLSSSSVLLPGNYQQHLWTFCGANERYSPPVLLFSDDDVSPATLVLKSGDATRRGKLLAHFSFTSIEHSAPLGLQVVGAIPAHGSDCDWHYQQADCLAGAKYNNTCRMASPGYPGLYPPNRKCRYHVAIQSPFQPLTLQFTSVQLPPQRCKTDNVRVYVNGRLHSTLCGQQTLQLITHGPDVVVEFNSGELRSPYVFNGFVAQMSFRTISPDDAQQGRHRHPSPSPIIPPTDIPNGAFRAVERQAHAVCDYVIKPLLAMRSDASSDRARWSGFFSTSITAWKVWPAPCSFSFPTQMSGQRVQLSIFTYNLTGADCTSFLDIHEGGTGGGAGGGSNEARWSSATRRHQICSPVWKKSRNSYSKFNQPFLIQSNNGSSLSVRFRMDPLTGTDQIIEGAFAYYDEFDGQRKQGTLCDTAYDGLDSHSQGFYVHGFDTAVFWPVTGPFNCTSIFTPRDGQTITITIVDSVMKDGDGRCYTDCDRYGCHCRTNSTSVVDRVTVSLVGESDAPQLVCLCGDIQAFLPLSLTSNAALSVQQHVNEFTFGQQNLRVQFGYSFSERRQAECGHNLRIDSVSGSIKPLYFGLTDKSINQLEGYHHTDCLWVAGIPSTEQWVATVTPPKQGHCEDWNMTFHHYDESWPSRLGDALDLVCPGEEKVFAMPSGVKIVAVRLQAWGTSPIEYRLDWKTISLAPRPTPATAVGVQRSLSSLITTSVPAVVVAAVPADPGTAIAKSVASMFTTTGGLLHQSYMFLLLLLVAVLSLRF